MLPPRLIDRPPPNEPRRLVPPKLPPERGAGARRTEPPKLPPDRDPRTVGRERPKEGALPAPIDPPVRLAPLAGRDTRGADRPGPWEAEPLPRRKVGARDVVLGVKALRDPVAERRPPAVLPAGALAGDTRERPRGWNVERRLPPRLPSTGFAWRKVLDEPPPAGLVADERPARLPVTGWGRLKRREGRPLLGGAGCSRAALEASPVR